MPSLLDKFNLETAELNKCKQKQKKAWKVLFNGQMILRNDSNIPKIQGGIYEVKIPWCGFPYKQGNLKNFFYEIMLLENS